MRGFKYRPVLRWSPARWFGVTVDFGFAGAANIVTEIKTFPCRTWDPQAKTWWLPETFLPHVESALISGGYNPEAIPKLRAIDAFRIRRGEAGDRALYPPAWLNENPYYVLGILPQVPDFLVDAAYEALKRALDPDRGLGGSSEPYDRVVAAYNAIKQERAAIGSGG